MTAFYLFKGDENLGGIICLSGLNPLKDLPTISKQKKETKILAMNGTDDKKVFFIDAYNTLYKRLIEIYSEPYSKNFEWVKLS
jgi:predicted esterase